MKKILLTSLILIIALACSQKSLDIPIITIKGSDSMLQLTENLAEEYMKINPGVSIYVYGGGTGKGVEALISGETDICTASRNLKPEETKALADFYGSVGMFYLVAKDALCIYVNKFNPVKNLSMEELKKIFECEINNWKELGGKNQLIIPVIRNINSGTHFYFKEHVMEGDDYCIDAKVEATTPDIIKFIEANENAIGYSAIGYTGDVAKVKIEGIEPSENNARNDSYPITRYLHFFTTKVPTGPVKNFIDWVLSPDGQKIIKQSGFIPLWDVSP